MLKQTLREQFSWFFLLSIIDQLSTLSSNRPKFCPIVSWETSGTTFVDQAMVGSNSYGLFIDKNNTIYANDRANKRALIWFNGNHTSAVLLYNRHGSCAIFATDNGDIFIDAGAYDKVVDKWSRNLTSVTPVMIVAGSCSGLFVDTNNTLYCAIASLHQVLRISLNDYPNTTTIIAGTGTPGSSSDMLDGPTGIFVDVNFDLYVADTLNNRIQLFQSGQTSGTTIVQGFPLIYPQAVMMDGSGYLYIVNTGSHNIIRSGPGGSRCIIGCTGSNGSNPNQLSLPTDMGFDSYGNLFILDTGNNRIQKFLLKTNSCINYNRPKLSPCATWSVNATTVANSSVLGDPVHGIFIDLNDTLYFVSPATNQTLIWTNNSVNPVHLFSDSFNAYITPVVSADRNLYYEQGQTGVIRKYNLDTNTSELVLQLNASCCGLFLDLNNVLYCSMKDQKLIISIPLNANNNNSNVSVHVTDQLSPFWGIFVDTNMDVYGCEAGQHRIQRFQPGQVNGTIVAGNSIPNNLTLNLPTDVILDADGNMFIADNENHRIIRVNSNNSDCIAACSGQAGPASNQLRKPYSLRFDSRGNLYVADEYNYRIQKFLLATNSCDFPANNSIPSTVSLADELTTVRSASTSIPFSAQLQSNSSTFSTCEILQPCQNAGTCNSTNLTAFGYTCLCPAGFNGIQCQFDHRSCRPQTCWNSGICKEKSNETFECQCAEGWQGVHCETKINYCENITCRNNGICRSLLGNYTCECLGESFSGRYCEITSRKTSILQIIAKSWAGIAITCILVTAGYIVTMDVLKYGFNIDPISKTTTKEKSSKKKKGKKKKKRKPPVIIRYKYVHSIPSILISTEQPIYTIEGASV